MRLKAACNDNTQNTNNNLRKMSGYRCVNYYELCRLCTASQGTKKVHIFSEEAKKTNLLEKILGCLPIVIRENDKLPKIVCAQCLQQVESTIKFRESCMNAQTMLESCLNSSKLRNGEKVYIKDVTRKKPSEPPQLVKTISNAAATTAMVKAGVPLTIGKTTLTKAPVQKNSTSSDFLSSIIQAVGIQNVEDTNDTQIIQPTSIQQVQSTQQPQQPIQQYTITLDGQTLKTNQIHYKIEPSGAISIQEPSYVQQIATPVATQQTAISSSTLAQVDEFLKLKPSPAKSSPTITAGTKRKEQTVKVADATPAKKAQKINWVLASPMVQTQQQKVQTQVTPTSTLVATNAGQKTQTISLQDLKFYSANNKCLLPITLKDGSNNDQQVMAQIDSKNIVLPGAYLQMKLQPQLTTVDGQQVVQLTSATSLPTSISLAPNQQPQFVQSQIQLPQQIQQIQQTSNVQTATLQQAQIVPETRTLFTTSTGQNVTVTHHPIQMSTSTADQSLHTSTVETSAGKVQLTTLQNVATPNVTHPLPQSSAITFQRVKVEPPDGAGKTVITSPTTKKITNQQTFKLATLANSNAAGKATTAKKPAQGRVLVTTSAAKVSNVQTSATNAATRTTTATGATGDAPKSDVPTCEICEKVFKRKEHLAQHMKLHLGLRPFKCDEPNCNKTFSRKEHLMRHVVSHSGKKQYECDICHKLFSRKDNLNKHKRSHKQVQQAETVVYTVTEVS